MDWTDNILNFYAILNILLGIYNLWVRNKTGNILTAVSGFHLTYIMFLGVGFLAYTNYDTIYDSIGRDEVLRQLEKIAPYLLIGYSVVSYLENRKRINDGIERKNTEINLREFNSNFFSSFFLILSYFGLFFSQTSWANSGIGTFIPIFNNFIYPVTILIIIKAKRSNPFSIVLLILLIMFVGFESLISVWRSQLIMFSASILIGLSIRGHINYWLLGLFGSVYCFFILPFQELKKMHYAEYHFNPSEAFKATLDYDIAERIEIVAGFLATRINYMREMAFVQSALENSKLESRNGESYTEVFYQLIPRTFWKDKPSYNYFTGFVVPRKIGLLDVDDLSTSWGVNSFAEFMYNFSYVFLPVYLIILYVILISFDHLCENLELSPEYKWFLNATLFFLSLNLISIMYSSTYFLWTFIIIYFFDRIKKNGNTSIRRN